MKIISYEKNMGKGYAVKVGSMVASKELVTFLDADAELDPNQLGIFLNYMKKFGADLVIGSKRHPKSKVKYPLQRKVLSIAYNLLTRLLFGFNVKDTQSGLKLLRRRVIRKVIPKLRVKRYAFDVELLAYANAFGFRIVEAPIVLKFSRKGLGRLSPKATLHIFIDTMAIARRFYITQYYSALLRNTGIGMFLFALAIYSYKKLLNPFAFPGIENRLIYFLILFAALLIFLNFPFEKIARRWK